MLSMAQKKLKVTDYDNFNDSGTVCSSKEEE
jgi:hypothetical protein